MSEHATQHDHQQMGIVIGGSGLVGGTIVNYFKERCDVPLKILAPSSKKLSLREPKDIREYLQANKPDFVVNAAIANIRSDEQLSYEVNYLGPLNLARACAELEIPYIHISSAATLELGTDITEDQQKQFTPGMSNYTRSKLMAEKSLRYLSEHGGLDYTLIRLAAVYGNHDHKIQGIHRMLFSVADESMPVLFTRKGILHSYSNCRKLPYFIHHMLENREEFTGNDYNFVDKEPIELADLILTVKSYLQLNYPKEIYVPYPLAHMGQRCTSILLRILRKFGLKAELPSELVFLKQFYITQTLSSQKMRSTSFVDPFPQETLYARLPDMIIYYLTRWSHQNLITTFDEEVKRDREFCECFKYRPEELLNLAHAGHARQISSNSRPEEGLNQQNYGMSVPRQR